MSSSKDSNGAPSSLGQLGKRVGGRTPTSHNNQIGKSHGTNNSRKHAEPTDSEDLSMLTSDEEMDPKQEGKITVLGNGISN